MGSIGFVATTSEGGFYTSTFPYILEQSPSKTCRAALLLLVVHEVPRLVALGSDSQAVAVALEESGPRLGLHPC